MSPHWPAGGEEPDLTTVAYHDLLLDVVGGGGAWEADADSLTAMLAAWRADPTADESLRFPLARPQIGRCSGRSTATRWPRAVRSADSRRPGTALHLGRLLDLPDGAVTITDGTKEPFDLALVTATAAFGAEGTQAERVFDSEKGVIDFEGTLGPGQKGTAKLAFSAPTKDTSKIALTVTPSFDDATALFEGSL